MTTQETALWDKLRRKSFSHKFKRQHSIGNFVVDFYCSAKKLVIELDGRQHLDNVEYDKERTEYFESLNIKVIRFWNDEVDKQIDEIMQKIKEKLD